MVDGTPIKEAPFITWLRGKMSGNAVTSDQNDVQNADKVDAPQVSTETAHGEVPHMADGGLVGGWKPGQLDTGLWDGMGGGAPPPMSSYEVNQGASQPVQAMPAPAFDPHIGKPPVTASPVTPVAPPPPVHVAPQAPAYQADPRITAYLDAQKSGLNKYGADAQMANLQQSQDMRNSLRGRGAVALGSLADGIMQGVARAGSSNFANQIEAQENGMAAEKQAGMEKANEANTHQTEANMSLDAMNPNSTLSKNAQAAYGPLLQRMGMKVSPSMTASQLETLAKIGAEYGGKEMEMMFKQAQLQLEAALRGQSLKFEGEKERHEAVKDVANMGVVKQWMTPQPVLDKLHEDAGLTAPKFTAPALGQSTMYNGAKITRVGN